MELIPEWAPNIHPMLVHFPIAILVIAILFDFISFFLPKNKKWWTEEATALLYGVGAAIATGVYFTGVAAADSVFLPAEAQSVLTAHADWALWTVWFYAIYAVARILSTWRARAEHETLINLAEQVIARNQASQNHLNEFLDTHEPVPQAETGFISGLSGRVLEIGPGTGANPRRLSGATAVKFRRRYRAKMGGHLLEPVELRVLNACSRSPEPQGWNVACAIDNNTTRFECVASQKLEIREGK